MWLGWWTAAWAVPFAQAPMLVEGASTALGVVATAAGDLDGDGVAELISGARHVEVAGVPVGQVRVLRGGPTPTPWFVVEGAGAWTGLGRAVAVGDVSCDGIADLVVAADADFRDPGAGAVMAWFGPMAGAPMVTAPDLVVRGDSAEDLLGDRLLVSPDLTGDGCDDLVIGGDRADVGPTRDAGAVYVVAGGTSGAGAASAMAAGWVYGTTQWASAGAAFAVGEFDGDGRYDLVVGEPGAWGGGVYVVLAADLPAGGAAVNQVGTALVLGRSFRAIGAGVAAGDVDGDGLADLLVGAPGTRVARGVFGAVCLGSLAAVPLAPGTSVPLEPFVGCVGATPAVPLFGEEVGLVQGLRAPGQWAAMVATSRETASEGWRDRVEVWDLAAGLPTPGSRGWPAGTAVEETAWWGLAGGFVADGDVDGDGGVDLLVPLYDRRGPATLISVW